MPNQLKKTNENLEIWGFLMLSLEHRQALLKELNKFDIPASTTPDQLVNLIGTWRENTRISFSDKDLPESGPSHARALYVRVEVQVCTPSLVLIDNGSALNICPRRTASKIGMDLNQLTPTEVCMHCMNIILAKTEVLAMMNIL